MREAERQKQIDVLMIAKAKKEAELEDIQKKLRKLLILN